MSDLELRATYSDSHALVIGINQYQAAPPLGYARNDAQAVAKTLTEKLRFPEGNVRLLLDEEATRSAIAEHFFSLTETGINDRVIIFFAGHGHTVPTRRGQAGFLVPYDGSTRNLASLIRWEEWTKNSDLIGAKHVLFLMDACYGGLAVTRAVRPGSMRFLRDMLLRPARQVLTAGKADETVADLGGPLPGHSVFTGYLLKGLDGEAADTEGVITANGLMAYVYQKVGRDPQSHQTPHYGHLTGDGDMILLPAELLGEAEEMQREEDTLVSIPAVMPGGGAGARMTSIEEVKELLAEERNKIRLHDLVAQQTREAISLMADDRFSVMEQWSLEGFIERVQDYDALMADLCGVQALLAYWGGDTHREILTLAPKRISDGLGGTSGMNKRLVFRWYPVMLLLYAGGVAAVASERYDNLRALMQAGVASGDREGGAETMVLGVGRLVGILEDAFKALPGHGRNYAPRSEYLYKHFQPMLDDLLFLGAEYESHFDRFEVFLGLEHAEQYAKKQRGRVWGPIGRFGWKFHRGENVSPLHGVIREAERWGDAWRPIRAGLFGGSMVRFREVVSGYMELVSKLGWW